jgi:prolyl-tRNA synthetase
MRTRAFLRTAEFLRQEGHTAHATAEDAISETKRMRQVYQWFFINVMSIDGVMGEKSANERFAGADNTFTIEQMMQDGKALQSCTSHFL